MDEKTKLYVFSRREVALIFLFLLLVSLTSFVLGVRVGKGFSFEKSGLSPADKQRVDLLSGQEEKVNEVVNEVQEDNNQEIDQEKIKKRLEDLIREETNKDPNAPKVLNKKPDSVQVPTNEGKAAEKVVLEGDGPSEVETKELTNISNEYTGRYTIQLGSHKSIEDAKAFAEGFRVRGYDPIIHETEIPNRGTWYRVSLGTFESVTEAKDYVKKEKSLFQGQDYHFARFE